MTNFSSYNFPFLAKMLVIQIPLNVYYREFIIEISYNFLYIWNCMEMYDKKFPIYENCMISIFGQPGLSVKPFNFRLS